MTYELANELKEAGFTLPVGRIGAFAYEVNGEIFIQDATGVLTGEDVTPIPILSELIEACGEDFYGLFKKTLWIANAYNVNEDEIIGSGSTPEEAVARLWISLNKKVE